jgi:predicted protein tyrosine phosphatase
MHQTRVLRTLDSQTATRFARGLCIALSVTDETCAIHLQSESPSQPNSGAGIFGSRRLRGRVGGLNPDASTTVTPELPQWADVVFAMERSHRNKLSKKFRAHLISKRIICFDIPDEFEFMDPVLVTLLQVKVGPFFQQS